MSDRIRDHRFTPHSIDTWCCHICNRSKSDHDGRHEVLASHRVFDLPDDYPAGHDWERGQEHDERVLFTITVEEHPWHFDDGVSDPDRRCPSDEQVRQLGYNAGEATWGEMWHDRLGLALNQSCIVTVRDADGRVIHSMSK